MAHRLKWLEKEEEKKDEYEWGKGAGQGLEGFYSKSSVKSKRKVSSRRVMVDKVETRILFWPCYIGDAYYTYSPDAEG